MLLEANTSKAILRNREPWLLIFNCQASGLGNCLNLLSNSIHLEHYDPTGFVDNADAILARLDSYARILIHPGIERQLQLDLGGRTNVWRLPSLGFSGYHPDLCYLALTGDLTKGPVGPYHSMIAYGAFCCGLDENETIALFCEETFEHLGYFDSWEKERAKCLGAFEQLGFDMGRYFIEWSRNGPWMYSINHPKIHCLRDLGKAVLNRANLDINGSDILPLDNLANGPVFPIYPEIGSRLGVRGSYFFKRGNDYRLKPLNQFVSESFNSFRNCSDVSATPSEFLPLLENVRAFIRTSR